MVDKLRFRDDNGQQYPDWEEKTLGELVDRVYQPKTIAKSRFSSEGYAVYGANGKIGTYDKYNHEQRQIVVSCRGNVGTVNITEPFSWINGNAMVIALNATFLPSFDFVYHLLQISQLEKLQEGSGQPQITRQPLLRLQLSTPTSENERLKIASFLGALDERIEATEKRVELLKEQKKGYAQRIFSQELRFRDDNGQQYPDWEEKTLGEVADFFKGQGIPKTAIDTDGENDCVHYGRLFGASVNATSIIQKTSLNKGFWGVVNDVLMPTSDVTPKGLATATRLSQKALLGGDILVIRCKEGNCFDGGFLSEMIRSNRDWIIRRVSGTSVKHLYASSMKELKFGLPSLPEQQKIASFLGALDERIEATEKRVELLKEQKKGYAQRIFA